MGWSATLPPAAPSLPSLRPDNPDPTASSSSLSNTNKRKRFSSPTPSPSWESRADRTLHVAPTARRAPTPSHAHHHHLRHHHRRQPLQLEFATRDTGILTLRSQPPMRQRPESPIALFTFTKPKIPQSPLESSLALRPSPQSKPPPRLAPPAATTTTTTTNDIPPALHAPRAPKAAEPQPQLSFFRLTDQELSALRRKCHKPKTYQFRGPRVAKELSDLGRGWDGYMRARDEAERQGRLDDFSRRVRAELDAAVRDGGARGGNDDDDDDDDDADALLLRRGLLPLPPGAVDMRTAEEEAARHRPRVSSAPQQQQQQQQQQRARRRRQRLIARGEESETVAGMSSEAETRSSTRLRSGSRSDRAVRVKPRPKAKKPPTTTTTTTTSTRPPSPTPREIYDSIQPHFVQFACEWHGCSALLHNMETLRKHVAVVHLVDEDPAARRATTTTTTTLRLQCRWADCADAPAASIQALRSHVDARHMTALLWRMGDGPHGGRGKEGPGPSSSPPAYLFLDGKQVTPWVCRDQELETAAERHDRRRRLRAFLLRVSAGAAAPTDSEPGDGSSSSDDDDDDDVSGSFNS